MSRSARQDYPAENRIKNRQDYLTVQSRGQRLRTPHFYVYVLANQTGESRLGVTASRRVGNSVVRNRVKRLVREFFRLHKIMLPAGHDISVIVRPGSDRLRYSDVVTELTLLLSFKPDQAV